MHALTVVDCLCVCRGMVAQNGLGLANIHNHRSIAASCVTTVIFCCLHTDRRVAQGWCQ